MGVRPYSVQSFDFIYTYVDTSYEMNIIWVETYNKT